MKIIVAGSRSVTDYAIVAKAIEDSGFDISEVVSGRARGVDDLGEQWAANHRLPVNIFPADWNRHGKSAGAIRNVTMAHNADGLIAIWDGSSRGTKHMIDTMTRLKKPIFVYQHNKPKGYNHRCLDGF